MKYFLTFSIFIFLINCKKNQKSFTANEIIDKSIEASGGNKFDNSDIEFDFRDKHYLAQRKNGKFLLARAFNSEGQDVFDVLNNEGFERSIDGKVVEVLDSMIPKYSASVNSVHYFSVLPYGLNDNAVNKELLGITQIKNKAYYKVKVTFNEVGGGEDFEDVFVYWINTETFKPDYLAYSYNEDDGKGLRFREVYNERYVGGLRFVDYNNYKPVNSGASLFELDALFEDNQLKLLSKIELKNISVN